MRPTLIPVKAMPYSELDFCIARCEHEGLLSAVYHIFSSISPLLFHTIHVSPPSLLTYKGGHLGILTADSNSPIINLLPLCNTIDNALADQNYRSLVRGIHNKQYRWGGATIPPDCVDDLYRELFPKLMARGIFDRCNGECSIHRCAITPL